MDRESQQWYCSDPNPFLGWRVMTPEEAKDYRENWEHLKEGLSKFRLWVKQREFKMKRTVERPDSSVS